MSLIAIHVFRFKGILKEMLFTTMTLDGNNSQSLLAYAIVRKECDKELNFFPYQDAPLYLIGIKQHVFTMKNLAIFFRNKHLCNS